MTEAMTVHGEEYAASRQRIRAAVDGADDAAIVPACPAWTVHDLVAHLAGLATALTTGQLPGGDIQAWVDAMVDERRSVPTEALLDEWDRSGPAFEAMLSAQPQALGTLLFDVIAHEHDLRAAVGRPGGRDAHGVLLSLDVGAGLFDGHVKAGGLPAIELATGDRRWQVGEGDIALALSLDDPWELLRVIGSRRSATQLRRLPWEGDLEPYLGAFHLPLPEDDLIE